VEKTPLTANLLRVFSGSAACQDLAGKGNAHNKLLTEWNTQSTIMAGIICQEQVDLVAWLAPNSSTSTSMTDEPETRWSSARTGWLDCSSECLYISVNEFRTGFNYVIPNP
jgi:hypothetical protein